MKSKHAPCSKPGPAILLSLPVPGIVLERETGNIPLGIASIALYAHRTGSKRILNLIPQDNANTWGDHALVASLLEQNPSIIGLNCSVWNVERAIYFADRIKQAAPGIQIWLGGPEVAEDSPFIANSSSPFDLAISGEGETTAASLLKGTPPWVIHGLLLPGAQKTQGDLRPGPLCDLSPIHDPFIDGLVKNENDRVLYAEFRRGCRHGCAFCRYHQGRKGRFAQRPLPQIADLFAYARTNRIEEIYILDPSFEQHENLEKFLAFLSRENRNPTIPLFVELRAEAITARLAELLHEAGVRKVETGLQSVSAAALAAAGRKAEPTRFLKGIDALRKAGIEIKTDIMAGLPNDTAKGWQKTIDFVLRHGLDKDLQIFRTQVLPGTTLRRQAQQRGIQFQEKPPYHIIEAPGWSAEELDSAIDYAQRKLKACLLPEMRPVLFPKTQPNKPGCLSTGAHYQFVFNLDKALERRLLQQTSFENAAAAVVLWIEAKDPNPFSPLIVQAIDRLVSMNPFSSVSVLLACESHIALDIADAVNAALNGHLLSSYLQHLHAPGAGNRPQRRLFFMLRCENEAINKSWIAALRQTASIIWRADVAALQKLSANFDAQHDYIFFQTDFHNAERKKNLFARIRKSALGNRIIPFELKRDGT